MADTIQDYIFELRESFHMKINQELEDLLIKEFSKPSLDIHEAESMRQSALATIQFHMSFEFNEREDEISESLDRLASQLCDLQKEYKRTMILIERLGLTHLFSYLDNEENLIDEAIHSNLLSNSDIPF